MKITPDYLITINVASKKIGWYIYLPGSFAGTRFIPSIENDALVLRETLSSRSGCLAYKAGVLRASIKPGQLYFRNLQPRFKQRLGSSVEADDQGLKTIITEKPDLIRRRKTVSQQKAAAHRVEDFPSLPEPSEKPKRLQKKLRSDYREELKTAVDTINTHALNNGFILEIQNGRLRLVRSDIIE